MTRQVKIKEVPKTTIYGGVELQTSQIARKGSFRDKGHKIFHVEFTNGMLVQYEDQNDKRISKYKLLKNTPSIFIDNSEISVYNIFSGYVQGTKANERINLNCSSSITVDGKGGKDIYSSEQYLNHSYNTYKMTKYVEYWKYPWKSHDYLKSAGEKYTVEKVYIPMGFKSGNYEFCDDENFSKEALKNNNYKY